MDEITDDDVTAMVAWRRAQKPKGQKDGIAAPATVNRSTTEVLKKLFTRAKTAWRYNFPNEPRRRTHMLKEPEARVRELKGEEESALEEAMRSDCAPWVKFTLSPACAAPRLRCSWSNVGFKAKAITTVGKGGRTVTSADHAGGRPNPGGGEGPAPRIRVHVSRRSARTASAGSSGANVPDQL